jgi:hypothetical protein
MTSSGGRRPLFLDCRGRRRRSPACCAGHIGAVDEGEDQTLRPPVEVGGGERRTTSAKVEGRVEPSSSSPSESAHRSYLVRPKEVVVGQKGWAVGETRRREVEEAEAQMTRDAHVVTPAFLALNKPLTKSRVF